MLAGIVVLVGIGVAAAAVVRSRDERPLPAPSNATTPSIRPTTSPTVAQSVVPPGARPVPATTVSPEARGTGASEVRFDQGGQVTIDGRAFDASIEPVEVSLAPDLPAIAFGDPPPGFVVEVGGAAGDDRVALPGALGGRVLDLSGVDTRELVLVVTYGGRPASEEAVIDGGGCFPLPALGVELCFSEPVP